MTNEYNIITMRSRELTRQLRNGFCRLFREGYSCEYYGQLGHTEDDPLTALPPTQFSSEHLPGYPEYFSLDVLDSIQLPAGTHRWMHPDITNEVLEQRFDEDGFVCLMVETESEEVVGLYHLRTGPAFDLITTEEWVDSLLFSELSLPESQTDPSILLERLDFHFGIRPDDEIAVSSAQLLHPTVRGERQMFEMMRSVAEMLPQSHLDLKVISEIPASGPGNILNRAVNDRCVHGILANGHSLVMSERLETPVGYFLQGEAHYYDQVQRFVQQLRLPYRAHPLDHAHLEIGDGETGVYATDIIRKGETVAIFDGELYRASSISQLPGSVRDTSLQVGPDTFRHVDRSLANLVAHSCSPNTDIRGNTELFAVRDIMAGEEICFDRRCAEDYRGPTVECDCGSHECTGVIAGFSSLHEQTRLSYLSRGMVSDWIVEEYGLANQVAA